MSGATPTDRPLVIERLRFRYSGAARAQPVAARVDRLELAPGEQLLLVGGSGAGKSTLLQLIAGLLDPDEGNVLVAGQDLHALKGSKRDLFRGKHIGMIFQTFNLLVGFTALENVMAALMFSSVPRNEHRTRASKLLEHLGVDRVGADIGELSVGQQQRVAVARAVVVHPELVLADEPTASLDPSNTRAALDLIQEACRENEAALVCVSHDPTIADRFDRVITLDELAGAQPQEATG